MRIWHAVVMIAAVGGLTAFIPVGGEQVMQRSEGASPKSMDLSSYSSERPTGRPGVGKLRLLFIHHSCGGQWFASSGAAVEEGSSCIYRSHPNGGGLRSLLEPQGYEVHEASYGSVLGDRTDLFDWPSKFRAQMDLVLSTAHQDERYSGPERNHIVMFKSCFPNNEFVGEGAPPGDAKGPELTIWNAKAALTELLEQFRKHPEVLFVYVTAPPIAPQTAPEPLWKWAAKRVLGKPRRTEQIAAGGRWARQFERWAVSTDGWLREYPAKNVVVFDYYDVLTGHGESDLSVYATGSGRDSHPSAQGNRRAAQEFIPFLNRSVRRAGLDTNNAIEGVVSTP